MPQQVNKIKVYVLQSTNQSFLHQFYMTLWMDGWMDQTVDGQVGGRMHANMHTNNKLPHGGSFIAQSVLWQVHSCFQSVFTECNFVLHLSISSILSFPSGHPAAAYVFFISCNFYLPCILLSVTYFRRQFLHKMWTNQLPLLYFIVCRIFLSTLTLCNTF